MSNLFSRSRKGSLVAAPGDGNPQASFSSVGLAVVTANVDQFLSHFSDISEVGYPGAQLANGLAGNAAASVETVPAGKYWRLVGLVSNITTDATAANRNIQAEVRDASDVVIDTVAGPAVAASQTAVTHVILFDDEAVGDAVDDKLLNTITWPADGMLLPPTYDVSISLVNGVAGDVYDYTLIYIQYDQDPRLATV
jgi:hypothetical protein